MGQWPPVLPERGKSETEADRVESRKTLGCFGAIGAAILLFALLVVVGPCSSGSDTSTPADHSMVSSGCMSAFEAMQASGDGGAVVQALSACDALEYDAMGGNAPEACNTYDPKLLLRACYKGGSGR